MKQNLPVTNKECKYSNDSHIVSTTDLNGDITYCNEGFIEISGYSKEELMGAHHNIVRHPDMPESAFTDLWANLKAGKSWMGVVKNRCKNGDFYWVDEFITPIFENGEMVAYQSVQVKPAVKAVNNAEAVNQRLKSGSSLFHRIKTLLQFGLMGKVYLAYLVALMPFILLILLKGGSQLAIAALVASLVIGLVMAKVISRPWKKLADETKLMFSNKMVQEVITGRQDELGQLSLALHYQEGRMRSMVYSIDEASGSLESISQATASVVDETNHHILKQRSDIEQVATAINQMSASVQQVVVNTGDAASSAAEAEKLAHDGALVATNSITSIMSMVSDAEQGASVIRQLATQTESIGSVLDVIRSIAEQTNLLALNAAIEAARAGEQGRGFAVVADEVRVLASRTHQSTQEIQDMIESLQVESQKAVDVMLKAQESAESNMDAIESMAENMAEISGSIQAINSMNSQIATAAEEQQAVADEINLNIANISNLAEQTAVSSNETAQETAHLQAESSRLRTTVHRFGIK